MSDYILFFGLFFPRITLALCFINNQVPINSTPFILDCIGSLFFPRLLIAFWAFELGEHPLWIAIYLIFGLLELLKPASSATRNKE
jgi:hypothetical protein